MKLHHSVILLLCSVVSLCAGERLPAGLRFVPGPVNGVYITGDNKYLAIYGNPVSSLPEPELLLLTHVRRDAIWAAYGLAHKGARVVAPDQEGDLLVHPEKFWTGLGEKRFHDYGQQSTKMPTQALPLAHTVKGDDLVMWETIPVKVLNTPGYSAASRNLNHFWPTSQKSKKKARAGAGSGNRLRPMN